MFAFKRGTLIAAVTVCIAGVFHLAGDCGAYAQGRAAPEAPFRQRQRVQPLPEGLTWLNTAGPIELKDLRGKFVLLDFWTYCCINCMHILPELKKLEHAYPNNLVVIGVHSAKFNAEQDAKNIREAIVRYRIEHPVINDADHAVWKRFGIEGWPTLVLIDPEGYAVWAASGETTFEKLDKLIKPALAYYRKKDLLDETPMRFDLEARRAPPTPLRFPGKVLADEEGGRLFIADSNHNRIVIAKLDGKLAGVIGSGATGRADGDFASAEFNQPQGMAVSGDILYVADTENHLIRKINLSAHKVTTAAGTGRQAREPAPVGRYANPSGILLSSPWDLAIHGDWLYIAMAGTHQIWRMRLDRPAIGPYAGNNREDIVDGALLPQRPYQLGSSSFAQPSGLACDDAWLYVADSEGSSIRAVPLDPRKEVRTVIGTSQLTSARLFTFGDVDGPAQQARLQHPLGVAWLEDKLYVADTYNNKIKVVDPASGAVRTLVGSGKPGRSDDPAEFDEPAGISAAADKLYVADTNNHLIRVVDLAGGRVSTLSIAGLEPPEPSQKPTTPAPGDVTAVELDPVAVRPENDRIRLAVKLQLPKGFEINAESPMSYRVDAADQAAAGPVRREALGKAKRLEKPAGEFEIVLPLGTPAGKETLRVSVTYYYCRHGAEGICKMGTAAWILPLRLAADAPEAIVPLRHEARF